MAVDNRWWVDGPSVDRARRVTDVVSSLWRDQRSMRDQMAYNARSYGDVHAQGLSPSLYRHRPHPVTRAARLSMNMTKSVTDTWVAMLTRDTPKISCLTTEGDWNAYQQAKKRERFLDGCFYETHFAKVATEEAYDVGKFGAGWLYFFEDDSADDSEQTALACERVLPWEIVIDDKDGTYRDPRSMHRIKWVDKAEMIEKYPAHADKIKAASPSIFDDKGPQQSTDTSNAIELVPAIASWHLPSFTEEIDAPTDEDPNAKSTRTDGRYSYVIGSATIADESWTDTEFPFERMVAQEATTGMWPTSLVEELSPQQRELNILLAKVQRSIHLLGAGHWLIPKGSKINTNKMDNQIGSMVGYEGQMPTFVAVATVNEETYAQIDRIKNSMYETSGVSPQLAQGQRPAGLDSGEAQRVHADIAAARFEPNYGQYQDFWLRSSKQFMRLAKRINLRRKAAGEGGLKVRSERHGKMAVIDFDDVDAPANSNILRLYPTNALPTTPEGRIAFAQELINSGMLPDKAAALRLLQFPDLAQFSDMADASYNFSMWCIEGILDDGVYRAPIAMMNIPEARALCVASYLNAARHGCPTTRLNLLLRWFVQLNDPNLAGSIAPHATAAPPPGNAPAPPGAPPAAPSPPPQMQAAA